MAAISLNQLSHKLHYKNLDIVNSLALKVIGKESCEMEREGEDEVRYRQCWALVLHTHSQI